MDFDFDTFAEFPKMARLSKDCIVTEKIDGTNAQIVISLDGERIRAASRNRFITPESDNFGFARWVADNAEQLLWLGPGRHFGEWWGAGIQRRYDMTEKVFSLFPTRRRNSIPPCCRAVPVLGTHTFDSVWIESIIEDLKVNGSKAAPGFMQPEGIIVYHTAGQIAFKKTIENDHLPKSLVA